MKGVDMLEKPGAVDAEPVPSLHSTMGQAEDVDRHFQNVLGLDAGGMQAFCEQYGEKGFRAKQLLRWIHKQGESSFEAMSDLAQTWRKRLPDIACIDAPPVLSDHTAQDGTRKWLFDVGAGNAVETVFIPETNRGTLCISSQAGCAVACRFCATGAQGFSRNLRSDEIIGQLWTAQRLLQGTTAPYGRGNASKCDRRPITNVVMMGMGEPLLNLEAVLPALRLMLDDLAYGLSRRRVTVSTSGVVPGMDRLAKECPVALAVSLHAADDVLRDVLVPMNKKYPLKELLAACERYLVHAPRDFITFEYVMLDGVNDLDQHARSLIAISKHIPSKFNLIPFNPFPHSGLLRSPQKRIKQFTEVLQSAGVLVTTRKTRGDDIDAACGQLAGEVQDRTQVKHRGVYQRPIPITPIRS